MSAENEILAELKKIGFKAPKTKKRQEYLAAIVRACDDLPDEVYHDKLSDDAADWLFSATTALKAKTDIPDFDEDLNLEEETDEAEDDDVDLDVLDDDEDEDLDVEGDDEETEPEDEADETEDDDDVAEEAEPEPENDEAEEEPEPEPEPEPKKKGKAKKEKAEKQPQKRPNKVNKEGPSKWRDTEKDKFGLSVGTKASKAAAMFESGSTMKQVKEATGGNKYNLLNRLVKAGHHVEKSGNEITLIHKDDFDKPKKKPKK